MGSTTTFPACVSAPPARRCMASTNMSMWDRCENRPRPPRCSLLSGVGWRNRSGRPKRGDDRGEPVGQRSRMANYLLVVTAALTRGVIAGFSLVVHLPDQARASLMDTQVKAAYEKRRKTGA